MNSADKQAVLHCLKSMIDEEVCEECPLYGTTGTDHCEKDCVRLAIEALEQEPFINKPCVSEKVCEHDKQMVLDKIRAEIDSHCSDNRDRNDGLYIAMKIIDKYKAESEDKE